MPRKLSFSAAARQLGGPERVAVWVTVIVAETELLVLPEAVLEAVAAAVVVPVLEEVALAQALSATRAVARTTATGAARDDK